MPRGGVLPLGEWLGDFMQDTRYAFRRLTRSRSFTLVALLPLAVGRKNRSGPTALLAAGLGVGMRSMLLGVSPADPISFASAVGMLFLVVLLATLVPARRASAVDPMVALRSE